MAKVTIYLPDELAERVKASGVSMSPVCQRALQQEVEKMQTTQDLEARQERIVVDVGEPPIQKAFYGTWLIHPDPDESNERGYYFGVALTRNGQIAVHVQHVNEYRPPELLVYSSLDEAAADEVPDEIVALAARELGEDRPIELDI